MQCLLFILFFNAHDFMLFIIGIISSPLFVKVYSVFIGNFEASVVLIII